MNPGELIYHLTTKHGISATEAEWTNASPEALTGAHLAHHEWHDTTFTAHEHDALAFPPKERKRRRGICLLVIPLLLGAFVAGLLMPRGEAGAGPKPSASASAEPSPTAAAKTETVFAYTFDPEHQVAPNAQDWSGGLLGISFDGLTGNLVVDETHTAVRSIGREERLLSDETFRLSYTIVPDSLYYYSVLTNHYYVALTVASDEGHQAIGIGIYGSQFALVRPVADGSPLVPIGGYAAVGVTYHVTLTAEPRADGFYKLSYVVTSTTRGRTLVEVKGSTTTVALPDLPLDEAVILAGGPQSHAHIIEAKLERSSDPLAFPDPAAGLTTAPVASPANP